MAPMVIHLSRWGRPVLHAGAQGAFPTLLGLLGSHFNLFSQGSELAVRATELAANRGKVDLREMLALVVLEAEQGGSEIDAEEHVDASDKDVIEWNHKIPEDIMKEIAAPQEVPAETVTVWNDPLDATQEYTEESISE
ncbi:inositol monophosphatase 3, partial [Sigmodon hispidus]